MMIKWPFQKAVSFLIDQTLAQILGQKSPFGGLCNCVRQKWGHANKQLGFYQTSTYA